MACLELIFRRGLTVMQPLKIAVVKVTVGLDNKYIKKKDPRTTRPGIWGRGCEPMRRVPFYRLPKISSLGLSIPERSNIR